MFNTIEFTLMQIKNLQYYLEPASFLIVTIILFIRYIGSNQNERPLLNKMFILGLSGWFLYSIMDIFLFELAWSAIPTDAPLGLYTGYPSEYPKLLWANIMRDFAIFGAMIMNWSFLIAAVCLKYGEAKTKHLFFQNKMMILIIIISTATIIAGDIVSVSIWEDGGYSASAFTVGLGAIFIYIAIGFYIIAAIYLVNTIISASKAEESPIYRRKLTLLSFGILFMGIGHTFWVIYSFIGRSYPTWVSQTVNWLSMSIIGHSLWMLCPIFILIGCLYGGKYVEKP